MWNPSLCDCEFNKACKVDKYLDDKSCSCESTRLIHKLVLACEDELLNTAETSLDVKTVTFEKNHYLIYMISLIVICFLLVVVFSVSF